MITKARGMTFGVVDRLDSGCMYAQYEHEDWQKKRENKCQLHWVVRGGCRQSVVRTEPLYTQKTASSYPAGTIAVSVRLEVYLYLF
jgi:hypothetical protein